MKPIRVLHVVTKMDAAGLETFIMNMYRNIDREKVQFDFLTHREEQGFYDKEIKKLGGEIYHVPRINPFKHKEYINRLDDFFNLSKDKYNIVHSHINTFSMYPLRSAQKANIPIRIAHSHIANTPLNLKTPFKIYTKSKLIKYSTHNFACSRMAGEWLYGKKSIKKNNFKIINNSIDANKFRYNKYNEQKLKEEMGLKNKTVIGHIGRFTKQKNHKFLIDVFEKVKIKVPEAILLLIGEGKLQKEIEKKVINANLQNSVIFMGVSEKIHEMIQVMDIFVFPSLYEGLGIVSIEAQAAGVPCIVSESVPNEAFITDRIRALSLNSSSEIWADEILKLLDYKKRDTYKEIVDSGYDVKNQAKELELFYLNVN